MPEPKGAVAVALAATALAVGLTGCGAVGDDEPKGADGTSSSPSSAPASPSLSIPTTPSLDGTSSTAKLPAGFPLPAKTKKTVQGTDKHVTAQLTVKDGEDAYDFWLKQLPEKGYEITSKNNVELAGTKATIGFHGHGYSTGRIAITGTAVALVLKK